MTRASVFEIAQYRWGPAHLDGTTDATWVTLVIAPSGALRVLQYDMGPETESLTGHFDHGQWIDVPAADAAAFTACMLHKAFDTDRALILDDVRDACTDWGIGFTEGVGPYSTELEEIA